MCVNCKRFSTVIPLYLARCSLLINFMFDQLLIKLWTGVPDKVTYNKDSFVHAVSGDLDMFRLMIIYVKTC